ncbi:CTP synthase C-terminal region-related (seleno)protein [Dinghuibacter silviterrae]|uniref:CTP synthase (glutamine hydrolyzing) n=1 Tax=Dinghuibacter silviterrae TaxID=1539049 RepID=A0A4R8DIL6_9BACT|nr:CTP synthase [Dinghuibacter silviterrae]TDW97599.1 glutamine amidotransferase class I [Dinghuibacter silviterrae]
MKLAIIGDFRKENATHVATNSALQHSIDFLGADLDFSWVHTTTIHHGFNPDDYQGFLIAPGSPYASMENVLEVIRFARLHLVPTLGTCGGFQHMIIEYARSVLKVADATHAETDPYASRLVITPLSCSLVGQRLDVSVLPGSRAFALVGASFTANYYCNFGLNPEYAAALDASGFRITGTDADGEVRILELDGHPFFMGTLFVPQASSTKERPQPLVTGFLEAVVVYSNP